MLICAPELLWVIAIICESRPFRSLCALSGGLQFFCDLQAIHAAIPITDSRQASAMAKQINATVCVSIHHPHGQSDAHKAMTAKPMIKRMSRTLIGHPSEVGRPTLSS